MRRAYIGLGANLGQPDRQIRFGIEQIQQLSGLELLAVSRFYRSPPMGPPQQPDYCNAVLCASTALEPRDLLEQMICIEQAAGRIRDGEKWGPRELDLDLLHMDGVEVDEPGLRLPHPGIASRSFVLKPLVEVEPGLQIPGVGRVADLARASEGSELRPWFAVSGDAG